MRVAHALALGALGLAACGETPTPPAARPVAQVVIAAAETAGVVGSTLPLSAAALDSAGAPVPGASIAWRALTTSRGSVDAQGTVTFGPSAGDFWVTARESHSGLADTVALHGAGEGELKWTWALDAGEMPDIGGPALGPDGTIYVLSCPFGIQGALVSDLHAIGQHGEHLWQLRLDRTSEDQVTVGPDGTLYVTGSTVRAISPQGQVRWSHVLANTFAPIFTMGALSEGGLLVVAKGEHPLALDVLTGDTVWAGPYSSRGSWAVPPTIAGSTVWIKKTADSLYAFDLATGAITRRIPDLDTALDKRAFGNGPVVIGPVVYLPLRNRMNALDTNGTVRWLTPNRGSGVSEAVIDAVGRPYARTDDGLTAFEPATGAQRWVRRECRNGPIWHGGPALTQGGGIICTALDGVYAFNTSGTLLWSYQTTEGGAASVQFTGAPAVAPDGTIYAWTAKHVYALWGRYPPDPASPWPMWRHDAQRTGRAR